MIKGEPLKAIIDTGASVSVISNKLRKELEIPVERKSKEVLVAANGEKIVVIEETTIEIEIGERMMFIEVRVVESRDDILIIGMNTLEKLEAKINIEKSLISGIIKGEEIIISIEFKKEQNFERKIYEEEKHEEENEEEYEEELEEPEYREFKLISKKNDDTL